ncbi:MAG: DUF2312 domain-containing protein [Alphaproteobacteria bacterium]
MTYVGGLAKEKLKSLIQRIERLEEEKAQTAEHIKEVYAEARHEGFDVIIMRKVIRLSKMDHQKRQEQEELIDLYMDALGLVAAPASANVNERKELEPISEFN